MLVYLLIEQKVEPILWRWKHLLLGNWKMASLCISTIVYRPSPWRRCISYSCTFMYRLPCIISANTGHLDLIDSLQDEKGCFPLWNQDTVMNDKMKVSIDLFRQAFNTAASLTLYIEWITSIYILVPHPPYVILDCWRCPSRQEHHCWLGGKQDYRYLGCTGIHLQWLQFRER